MIVSMWMNRKVITIRPETTISTAAITMSQSRVRHLLVTQDTKPGQCLIGIVSMHDVSLAFPRDLSPSSVEVTERSVPDPVSAIMYRQPLTTTPDTPVEEAASILRTLKIGALPVLHNARLVGIITESDILDAFMELCGVHTQSTRITFEIGDDDGWIETVAQFSRSRGTRLASMLSLHHSDRRSHTEQHLAVVRLVGHVPPESIEDIWHAGHRVLNVSRCEGVKAPDGDRVE